MTKIVDEGDDWLKTMVTKELMKCMSRYIGPPICVTLVVNVVRSLNKTNVP